MKFKIGDRVAYRAVDSGNTDLDGWVGTVVYVDSTSAPYTVRFDQFYRDGITDGRCPTRGGVRQPASGGHDWFCREENLTPLGVRRKVRRGGGRPKGTAARERNEDEGGTEPSHPLRGSSPGGRALGEDEPLPPGEVSQNVTKKAFMTKKQEEKDMARGIKGHEWTAAEDAVIREMPEGGSSVIDVCDRLGVDMVTMKNRLYALRKADPTFPRCMRMGRPSASEPQTSDVPDGVMLPQGGSDVPCGRDAAADGGDVPTGTLGELEQVLADQLEAVTKERDELQNGLRMVAEERDKMDAQIGELSVKLDAARLENDELARKVGEMTTAQVRLQTHLVEAHKSLAERDDEVRELAPQLEAVRRERDALIEEKECYTEEFEDGVAYYKQQAAEAEKIVSAQVDEMEKVRCESRRLAAEVCEVNRIVVGLVAGYVLNHTKEVGG